MKIKVLLVDDHPVFMAGIRAVLEAANDLSIVGEAKDGVEAVKMVKGKNPDVVVMDITMPNLNGIDATKQILDFSPTIKILALSIHSGRRFVKNMLDAGAAGYLLKDSAPEELLSAIQKVAKGEMYLSSSITSIALSKEKAKDENVDVLMTKLHRPLITRDYIIRTKALEQLEKNIDKPLSIISAPAGYGKSITISQWVERGQKVHTWISLDDSHNDPRIFFYYFKTAIEKLFPGILEKSESLISANILPPIKVLSHSIINELDQIQKKFILVLDDYHNIHEGEIHGFIEELLRFPPENMHLAILTRYDPPLGLSSLRVHDRMHEIRMDQLSFSENEINQLFKNLLKIELDKNTIKTLYEKTEGWIVGLRMASLIIDDTKDADKVLNNISGDIHLVSEFLISELLMKQPAKFQEQLLKSSILDRFCAEILEDIFYTENTKVEDSLNGSAFIEKLVSTNLFIIQLDNSRKWYRYHYQFQELLKSQLKRTSPLNNINEYHNIASGWFEKNKLIDEAIEHAIEAGNNEKVASIIENNAEKMINHNRWYVLQKWLSRLPSDIIQRRPELLLAKAWVSVFHFELEALSPIMNRIDQLMNKGSDEHSLSGEVAYFRAHYSIHERQGGAESLKLLDKALKLIPVKNIAIRSETELLYGIACQMEGQFEEAIKQLTSWLYNSISLAPLRETRLLLVLKFINYINGNPKEAKKYLEKGRNVAEMNGLEEALCWCNYLEGLFYLKQGDYKKSITLLEEVSKKRFLFHARGAVDALIALTIAYQMNGQRQNATDTILSLEEFNKYLGYHFSDFVNSCEARLGLLQENFESSFNWLATSPNKPVGAMLFWFEIASVTRCKILISEGSFKNLLDAELLLEKIIDKNMAHNNNLYLIEVLAIQALLFNRQERIEKSFKALENSLKLAEPGEIVQPFLELGTQMSSLMNKLPQKIKNKPDIKKMLNRIEKVGKQAVNVLHIEKSKSDLMPNNAKLFTSREIAVLNYVANGLRNKEIALKMFISDDTVKKHLYNMFQKLSVKNRLGLVSKARELGLI